MSSSSGDKDRRLNSQGLEEFPRVGLTVTSIRHPLASATTVDPQIVLAGSKEGHF
jgi:hypothetical protein